MKAVNYSVWLRCRARCASIVILSWIVASAETFALDYAQEVASKPATTRIDSQGANTTTGPAQAGDVKLGTLLLSESERRQVIARRRPNIDQVAPPRPLRLDGVVRRPDGVNVIIISGKRYREGEQIPSLRLELRVVDSGVVVGSQAWRVGEEYDPSTKKVMPAFKPSRSPLVSERRS